MANGTKCTCCAGCDSFLWGDAAASSGGDDDEADAERAGAWQTSQPPEDRDALHAVFGHGYFECKHTLQSFACYADWAKALHFGMVARGLGSCAEGQVRACVWEGLFACACSCVCACVCACILVYVCVHACSRVCIFWCTCACSKCALLYVRCVQVCTPHNSMFVGACYPTVRFPCAHAYTHACARREWRPSSPQLQAAAPTPPLRASTAAAAAAARRPPRRQTCCTACAREGCAKGRQGWKPGGAVVVGRLAQRSRCRSRHELKKWRRSSGDWWRRRWRGGWWRPCMAQTLTRAGAWICVCTCAYARVHVCVCVRVCMCV